MKILIKFFITKVVFFMEDYLIDSSFLVALFLEGDVHHTEILNFFDDLSKGSIRFYVSHRVLEETATVLVYKGNKQICNKFIDFIENDMRFQLIEDNHQEELKFYRKQMNNRISFVDASLIYLANVFNLKILTLDKDLIKISKQF